MTISRQSFRMLCVLARADDVLDLMERLSISTFLKSLLLGHLVIALTPAASDMPSYDVQNLALAQYDHAALAFRVLEKLKQVRSATSVSGPSIIRCKLLSSEHLQLVMVADEIALSLLDALEKQLPSLLSRLNILKVRLVQYFAVTKAPNTLKQQLRRLFESKLFGFTAPVSLERTELAQAAEDRIGSHADRLLIRELNQTISTQPKELGSFIQSVLQQLLNPIQQERICFAELKTLYCMLTGASLDNFDFYQLLFERSLKPLTGEQFRTYNFKELNETALKALIATKGMQDLLNYVRTAYTSAPTEEGHCAVQKPTQWRRLLLVERALLLLHNIPTLCDPLLKSMSIVQALLTAAALNPSRHLFLAAICEKALLVLKYFKLAPSLSEKESYLPWVLGRFVCERLRNRQGSQSEKELCFILYDKLIAFLDVDAEAKHLDSHKLLLYESMCWQELLDILVLYK